MGITVRDPAETVFQPGPDQDAAIDAVSAELADKGFVLANADKLVNWARTGSLMADDLRPGLLAPSR